MFGICFVGHEDHFTLKIILLIVQDCDIRELLSASPVMLYQCIRPVIVKRALIGSKDGWKLSTTFMLKSVL